VDDREGEYAINEEGLMIRMEKERPLVYAPQRIRSRILHHFHGAPAYGQLGVARTLNKLRRYFWWQTMARDVSSYVRICAN